MVVEAVAKRTEPAKSAPKASPISPAASLVVLFVGGVCLMTWHGCSKNDVGGADMPKIIGLTIYFIEAYEGNRLAPADLARVTHDRVAPDTVRSVFGTCTRIDQPSFWKGSYLGVAQCADGTEQRLALSKYGGFFEVLGSGHWYTVGEESVDSYNEMM